MYFKRTNLRRAFFPNQLEDPLILQYSGYPYNYNKTVILNELSGQIITRKKSIVVGNVAHEGIYLGLNKDTNEQLVIHSHPKNGGTAIVSLREFAQGNLVYPVERCCVNAPIEMLAKALGDVINHVPYNFFYANCQHLVSRACNNTNQSKGVNNFLIGLGIFGSVYLLTKPKKPHTPRKKTTCVC